jgi:S-adenosylmethionine decarboxylase
MSQEYQKGLHILATLKEVELPLLCNCSEFSSLVESLIEQYKLQALGSIYHNFEGGGFTAVICLSESHISIHTWPEYQMLNVDIYLSNYKRINNQTVKELFEALKVYFGGTVTQLHKIDR